MIPDEIQRQRKLILEEAPRWDKTPYVHGAHIKDAGISCSWFVAAVWNAALGTNLYVPEHPEQWFLNSKEQQYVNELKAQGFVEVPRDEVQAADLVISNTQYEMYCHGGILLNWPEPPTIIHVGRNGVQKVQSMYGSWYFAQKPDTHLYFSWGAWHESA